MEWKPNKIIAVVLALVFAPFGMLYIDRVKLAAFYLLVILLAWIADVAIDVLVPKIGSYVDLTVLCSLLGAVHVYTIVGKNLRIVLRPWYSRWYGLLSFPLLLLVLVFSFQTFFYKPYNQASASMSPTIKRGDMFVVSRWGYGKFGDNELVRGDIIVFNHPVISEAVYIKRVIGVTGDRIEFHEGKIILNGTDVSRTHIATDDQYKVYQEHIGESAYTVKILPEIPVPSGQIIVPNGHLFVMGDNRSHSNDSRYWGSVPVNNVIGKVVYKLQ